MSEYCKSCYELAEQLHRYKQAIEEIKDIAELDVYIGQNNKAIYTASIKQIIQKCDEVISE